ncbi:N-acetylmuramoyl-L-alanine amidase [Ferrimonas senticii]|uniref:N-acetylmuramoyl-L-alanine amidase n=1 Tax=Ferrimonas senticii TaxID=394566 RepID=UPI0004281568|nr:N-acetylmuramoyl-L-alanine amidase [Ferrimonas senticii]
MSLFCRWLLPVVLLLSSAASWANTLTATRIHESPTNTRLVFELSAKPTYATSRLSNPDRIVIDIKDTRLTAKLDNLAKQSKLLKRVRTSKPAGQGQLRLVLDMAASASYKAFALGPSGKSPHRLVVDLKPTKATSTAKPNSPGRKVVIAIDAGHGGKDPGSIGPSGTYEKNVVLPIAKKLKAKIDATPGFEAVLVRSGDYFVSLDNRSERARAANADLLLSVHADAFSNPQPRGASVWILSLRRANSEMGRWLEQDDKLSELRGIGEVISQSSQGDQDLSRTIVDLARQNNMAESHTLAGDILGEFKTFTKLHKREPQSASLAVLKSPDLVSMLVEVGFISNPQEERLLRSSAHQDKLATAMQKAVTRYFKSNPPRDSWLAQTQTHKVKSGESLSVIAQRYGVSLADLKQANKLRSNTLHIGQQLVIPRV